MSDRRQRRRAASAGFTLIELIVVAAMMGVFAMVFYGVFNFNLRVGFVQGQISDMQQNLRVAQHDIRRFARMAGRGGLPTATVGSPLPAGVAISVQNNVADPTLIGGPGSPRVLEGTDILTVRGVFTSSVYQLTASPADFAAGKFTFLPQTPTGELQDLTALVEAVNQASSGGPKEALVLVSPLGQYSIFGLKTGTVQTTGGINPVPLKVVVETEENAGYRGALVENGVNPPQMTTVASVGIVEEYRYYIRRVQPAGGPIVPRLSRARFFPGTNTPHPTNPFSNEDIADHIVDLQVALGVDTFTGTGPGGVPDGLIYEGVRDADADVDEWLFNDGGDVIAAAAGNLELLRISLMVRTSRADPKYGERRLLWFEDHDYINGPVNPAALDLQRRRRMSQTVVNLRNL